MARKEVNDETTAEVDVPAFVLEDERTVTDRKVAVYDHGEEIELEVHGPGAGPFDPVARVSLTRCQAKQLGAVLYGQGGHPEPLEFPAELITRVDWFETPNDTKVTVALTHLSDALREKLRELR